MFFFCVSTKNVAKKPYQNTKPKQSREMENEWNRKRFRLREREREINLFIFKKISEWDRAIQQKENPQRNNWMPISKLLKRKTIGATSNSKIVSNANAKRMRNEWWSRIFLQIFGKQSVDKTNRIFIQISLNSQEESSNLFYFLVLFGSKPLESLLFSTTQLSSFDLFKL